VWKKSLGLSSDKSKSCQKAALLWPDRHRDFYGPRGGLLDGRAEAALLAYVGYRTTGYAGRERRVQSLQAA